MARRKRPLETVEGHQWCTRCEQYQPREKWTPSKWASGMGHCKPCTAKGVAEWRVRHPEEYQRNNQRNSRRQKMKKYGMTVEDYEALLAKQGGHCAICKVEPGEPMFSQRLGDCLPVDHDHATGKVRGIICGACNTGLGQFRDDPRLLAAAVDYLLNPPAE